VRATLLVLLASGTAAADVTWTAPAGCPDTAAVRAKIERRLDGRSLADLAIDVRVTRSGNRLTATIEAGVNERTLTAAKCSELADAVALIVAQLAQAQRRVEVTVPIEVTALVPPVARPELALRMPVAEERPQQPAAWTAGVRALALSGIGMTPEVGVGADVSAFVQRDTRFLEVGYAKWVPRPMQILASESGTVQFDLQLVAVRGGWASTKMPLRGWIGLEVGQMHGEGPALRAPDSGVGRWVAISSGFGVGWPISPRTRLVGTFEVAVPIERAEFQFMDGSEVREPAPISARSALGVEVAWR
jgi:hypothetical protein